MIPDTESNESQLQSLAVKDRNRGIMINSLHSSMVDMIHSPARAWRQRSVMIRTSAVVTLSLCKLVGDLLLKSGEVFQISHLEKLLTALEAQYWHTLLFHGNPELLLHLSSQGFVVILPGPHLIDQEVQSAKIILRTIIDIYLSTENKIPSVSRSGPGSGLELDAFVSPWVSR